MKHQSGFAYALHTHFDSPVWDFLSDKKNEKVVEEIIDKRMEPRILLENKTDNPYDWQFDFLTALRYDLPMKMDKNGVLVCGLFIIAKRIIELSVLRLKDYKLDETVLTRILLGVMVHEYHTTGKFGEALRDEMDREHELQEQGKYEEIPHRLLEKRTMMIPLYTDNITEGVEEGYKAFIFLCKKLMKGEDIISNYPDKLFKLSSTFIGKEELLKFSKEGIDLLKKKGVPAEYVKGFQQTRIVRKYHSNVIDFLFCVIAAAYHDTELFMTYDPYYYELQICDNKGVNCRKNSINFMISFSGLIRSVFCPCCLEKTFGKYSLTSKQKQDKEEAIKAMFDEMYQLVSNVCPEELTITTEGKMKDHKDYVVLKEKLPHAIIGHDQYNGKAEKPVFILKKDLKGYRKRLKK